MRGSTRRRGPVHSLETLVRLNAEAAERELARQKGLKLARAALVADDLIGAGHISLAARVYARLFILSTQLLQKD